MDKDKKHTHQPGNMPPVLKMNVGDIPVIINYEKQQVTTPKGLGSNGAMVVGKYLADEGFLDYPGDKQQL